MTQERYRVLAIDYGTKRIGLAISDEMRMLASARGVIANTHKTIHEISELVKKEHVRIVLLGLPKTLSNTDSDMTKQVRSFGAKLETALQLLNITLIFRDERLTSIMANNHIAQSDLPKNKREAKNLRDEESARILLQEYLDFPNLR